MVSSNGPRRDGHPIPLHYGSRCGKIYGVKPVMGGWAMQYFHSIMDSLDGNFGFWYSTLRFWRF